MSATKKTSKAKRKSAPKGWWKKVSFEHVLGVASIVVPIVVALIQTRNGGGGTCPCPPWDEE